MVALLPEGHKLAKRKIFSAKFAETEAYIVTCPGLDIDGTRYLDKHGIKPNVQFSTMDIQATYAMVAINNLNMVTVMAVQAANNVITIVNGERTEEDMDGSMLDQYMGKDCTVSLFNEVGAIKGKLMDADTQWVKVDAKKGTQLINRNMVRNITFDNK